MIYEPHEDSYLLAKIVSKHARGTVLDMGTGSGIQALTAANKKNVEEVLAVDIDYEAVKKCAGLNPKIKSKQSDLFSKIKQQKFDTIIFNPPYLPQENEKQDIQTEGGKKGHETIQKFLEAAADHLKNEGKIILLFSSLTGNIDLIVKNLMLQLDEAARAKCFFEQLIVYVITKTKLLKELHEKGVMNLKKFGQGKRGEIYTGKYLGKQIAVKIKNPLSKARGRVQNETKWLILLRYDFMPKILFSGKRYFAYEFIKGTYFKDWLENPFYKEKILTQIILACYKLDRKGVAKEEMHRPLKHIIIKENKIKMIDFERTHKTKKPKNVTQFLQCLRSRRKQLKLRITAEEISKIAQDYTHERKIQNVIHRVLR